MASVRKRAWVTSKGVEKTAWVVDYTHRGKQHIKTFPTKREATAWRADMQHEVKQGTHTPASKSITVAEAGALWLSQAENDGLEASTVMQYRQHLNYHITPFLGDVKPARKAPRQAPRGRSRHPDQGRDPSDPGRGPRAASPADRDGDLHRFARLGTARVDLG